MHSVCHDVLRILYLLLKVWAEEKQNTFSDVDFKVDYLLQKPQCAHKWKKQNPSAH